MFQKQTSSEEWPSLPEQINTGSPFHLGAGHSSGQRNCLSSGYSEGFPSNGDQQEDAIESVTSAGRSDRSSAPLLKVQDSDHHTSASPPQPGATHHAHEQPHADPPRACSLRITCTGEVEPRLQRDDLRASVLRHLMDTRISEGTVVPCEFNQTEDSITGKAYS